MKTLTIAIPIYNLKIEWIDKAIHSALDVKNRTDKVQVIVIDNGSTNQEIWPHIKAEFENSDLDIHLVTDNRGKPSATEAAIKLAKGKYMLILDGDDWLDVGETVELVERLSKINSDMVFMNYTYAKNGGEKTRLRKVMRTKEDFKNFEKIPKFFWHFNHNVILNLEFMRKYKFEFPTEVTAYEDVFINMWNIAKAKNFTFINNSPIMYRIVGNGGNLSSTTQMVKRLDAYEDMVKETFKVDYISNKKTIRHTSWFASLQIIALVFWEGQRSKAWTPWKKYLQIKKWIKVNNSELWSVLSVFNLKHLNLLPLVLIFGTLVWPLALFIVRKVRP